MRAESTLSSQSRKKDSPPEKKESLYGLDIDILKSLQLDSLIEDKKPQKTSFMGVEPMKKEPVTQMINTGDK